MGGRELSKEHPRCQVGAIPPAGEAAEPLSQHGAACPPSFIKAPAPPKQRNASNPNQEAFSVEAAF